MTEDSAVNWSVKTVLLAALASLVGCLLALALDQLGTWPDWEYSHFIFGGLFAATAVHRMHPGHPFLALFVFVPVMSILLGIGTLLFHWYVLGNSI